MSRHFSGDFRKSQLSKCLHTRMAQHVSKASHLPPAHPSSLTPSQVQTYDGRRFLAKAYVSGPMATLPAEVAPTEKYMRLLREGAGDNYLDPLHQAWLSSVETVSSAGLGEEYWCTPSRFIAYGFLAVAALLVVGFFARP